MRNVLLYKLLVCINTYQYSIIMRKIILLLIFAPTVIISCGQNAFPDSITNTKTPYLTRVNGTRFFIPGNKNYHTIPKSSIFKKNEVTSISFTEIPNSKFNEENVSYAKGDRKTKIYKPVKFNGYYGVYIEGVDDGKRMISIFFGDNTFETTMSGTCPEKDQDSRKEILDIFRGSWYDRSITVDPFELANYKLDDTFTGFSFSEIDRHFAFKYSPNDAKAEDFISYSIRPLPIIKSYSEEKDKLEDELSASVENLIKKDAVINGYKAYLLHYNIGEMEIYKMLLIDGNSGVLFEGLDKGKKHIKQYQKVVESIRIVKQ